jgi:hypothetical protein
MQTLGQYALFVLDQAIEKIQLRAKIKTVKNLDTLLSETRRLPPAGASGRGTTTGQPPPTVLIVPSSSQRAKPMPHYTSTGRLLYCR